MTLWNDLLHPTAVLLPLLLIASHSPLNAGGQGAAKREYNVTMYTYSIESTSTCRLRFKLFHSKWIVPLLPQMGNIWQIQWDCSQYDTHYSLTQFHLVTGANKRLYNGTALTLWLLCYNSTVTSSHTGSCADVTHKVHTDHSYTYWKY